MSYTLEQYHYNSIKLGQILLNFCKDRGISKAALSRQTGISRDTLTHIITGDTQEVSFEKLSKICIVLGISLGMLVVLMTADEDIDFRDRIVLYNPSTNAMLPASDLDHESLPVPETVVAVAEAVTAAAPPADPAPAPVPSAEYVAFLQDHIKHLTTLLELSLKGGPA